MPWRFGVQEPNGRPRELSKDRLPAAPSRPAWSASSPAVAGRRTAASLPAAGRLGCPQRLPVSSQGLPRSSQLITACPGCASGWKVGRLPTEAACKLPAHYRLPRLRERLEEL